MINADYHAWLEANCSTGADKDNFTELLAIKTLNLLDQSISGGKITY